MKRKKRTEQRPYVGDQGAPLRSSRAKVGALLGMVIFAGSVGFLAGFVVWFLFSLVTLLTNAVWGSSGAGASFIASASSMLDDVGIPNWWLPIAICTFGGLIIGIWTKCSGVQLDELSDVMATIKATGEYRTKGLGRASISFLLPLTFGGSIGPEAGLTGVIATLVCWLGRALRAAGLRVREVAGVAVSAVFSAIFITPFIGVVIAARDAMGRRDTATRSSEEKWSVETPDPMAYDFRPWAKVILYICAALGAVGGMACVTSICGPEAGLPRFEGVLPSLSDLPWVVPCIILGYIGALLFLSGRFLFDRIAGAFGDRPVIKPVIGGFVLGLAAVFLPYVLFPGETQIYDLMSNWQGMGAFVLIATGLAKCLATPWCLAMGWKGGHFFPIIFAGVACGYGIALISGAEPIMCVCATTAALVASVQRSPLIALALLLLCFPLMNVPCIALSCFLGAAIPVPRVLLGHDRAAAEARSE